MTDQKPHPITLEQLFFTRSSVIAVPGHKPNGTLVSVAPQNAIEVAKIEGSSGRYTATMKTLVNPSFDKASPYAIDMECVAVLIADDTLSDDDAQRGVMITGHSVLYGAIREATAWLTGRQPYGQLMMGLSVLRGKPPETVTQSTTET